MRYIIAIVLALTVAAPLGQATANLLNESSAKVSEALHP